MSVTVTMVRCARSDRVCVIGPDNGVRKDGRVSCDAACADQHQNGAGRHHAGCTCHG